MSVEVEPGALTINLGGSDSVDVIVNGGSGPLELSVSGLPDGVTGTLSADAVDGSGASTLTLEVASSADAGTSEVTVTAQGGGQEATATLDLTVDSMDVDGVVLGLLGPEPGIHVAIGSKTAVTLADGSFTISDVPVPYDLVVYTANTGHVFEGLTSPTPKLMGIHSLVGAELAVATVEGSIGAAVPAGHEAHVCVEGLDGRTAGCQTLNAGTDTYSFAANTQAGATVDVRVHALVYSLDGLLPGSYTDYRTGEGTITAGATNPDIDLSPTGSVPPTETLSGTIDPPGALPVASIEIASRVSDNFLMPVVTDNSPSLSYSYAVPAFGPGTYDLIAYGSNPTDTSFGWSHDLTASDSTTTEMAAPAVMVSPPNGETGVTTDTTFTVGGTDGDIVTFIFIEDAASSTVFAVTTASDSTTIPDLSDYGLPLPASTAFIAGSLYYPSVSTDMNEAAYSWLGHYVTAQLGVQGSGPGAESDGGFAMTTIDVVTE